MNKSLFPSVARRISKVLLLSFASRVTAALNRPKFLTVSSTSTTISYIDRNALILKTFFLQHGFHPSRTTILHTRTRTFVQNIPFTKTITTKAIQSNAKTITNTSSITKSLKSTTCTMSKNAFGDDDCKKGNNCRIMMILSPAKTLDLTPLNAPKETNNNDLHEHDDGDDGDGDKRTTPLQWTDPSCNTVKTNTIAEAMKHRTQSKELESLLGISSNIAKTALEYWKNFQLDVTKVQTNQCKPAIYAFSGPAFQGVDIHTLLDSTSPNNINTCSTPNDQHHHHHHHHQHNSTNPLTYLQNSLRIIDPLYGVLKPMDKIQPYRLEMATKNVLSKHQIVTIIENEKRKSDTSTSSTSLTEWWKPSVTSSIIHDLQSQMNSIKDEKINNSDDHHDDNNNIIHNNQQDEYGIVLNLASDEYANAYDSKSASKIMSNANLKYKYIKVIFQQKGKVIAVHAKRARGLMVRYLAVHNVGSLDGVRAFDWEGYRCITTSDCHSHKMDIDDVHTIVFDREGPSPKQQQKQKQKQRSTKKTTKKNVPTVTGNAVKKRTTSSRSSTKISAEKKKIKK